MLGYKFINIANKIHNNKYKYFINNDKNLDHYKEKIDILCPVHGMFKQIAKTHLNKGCLKCYMLLKKEIFIKKAKNKHKNKYDYNNINYTGSKNKVIITCPIHGDFTQTPYSHIEYGCSKCAIENTIKRSRDKAQNTALNLIKLSKKKYNNKYDYSLVNYINKNTKVKIICPEHGVIEEKLKNHYSNNIGCKYCKKIDNGLRQRRTTEDFISEAMRVHGGVYDYSKTVYGKGNKDQVIVTCKKHGDFKVKPNNHIANKTGCPICKLSKGELKIAKLLNDLNISFKREYNIPDSNTKFRYDFYLPDLNILIEYDGRQHFEPVTAWGGEKELLNIQKRDKTKNKIAKEKGYKLIRIKYTEINNIKKYLLFRISRYFKYCVNNKWYRNFLELCKGEHLPGNIKPKDVKQYLIYK